ncbi:hypothetical protein SO802_016967 [Lithocarpus litseifolius]|uniref:Uncharacterized protein n=1 Tax=Lithocarpus litseifolius TaxID=425828 RepID=A0AAW2D3D3_9ROSI
MTEEESVDNPTNILLCYPPFPFPYLVKGPTKAGKKTALTKQSPSTIHSTTISCYFI